MTTAQDIVIRKLIEISADEDSTNKLFNDIAILIARFDTEKIRMDYNTVTKYYNARIYFRGSFKHIKRSRDKKVVEDAVNKYLRFNEI